MKHNYPEIDLNNPPEWFKKQAREMTNQEVLDRLADVNQIKKEATQNIEQDIPDLIDYLDEIYPKQKLIGFTKFREQRDSDPSLPTNIPPLPERDIQAFREHRERILKYAK